MKGAILAAMDMESKSKITQGAYMAEADYNIKHFFKFLWQYSKLALSSLGFGAIFVYASSLLHANSHPWLSDLAMALGVGAFLFGAINIVYEIVVRKSFLILIEKINSSVSSGVIIHKTHTSDRLLRRQDAISHYIKKDDEIRLMVSNGHKYVTPGEEPYKAICEKLEQGAKLKILLYLPFQDHDIDVRVKYARNYENLKNIREKQFFQMPYYNDLIERYKDNVEIKFFRHRMYMSYLCLASKVLYAALVFHMVSPASGKSDIDPCFEIQNLGPNSLFSLIYQDFTSVLLDQSTIPFQEIYPIFTANQNSYQAFWNELYPFIEQRR